MKIICNIVTLLDNTLTKRNNIPHNIQVIIHFKKIYTSIIYSTLNV